MARRRERRQRETFEKLVEKALPKRTRTQRAAVLGVSESTLANYLSGATAPHPREVLRLARATGVSVRRLRDALDETRNRRWYTTSAVDAASGTEKRGREKTQEARGARAS